MEAYLMSKDIIIGEIHGDTVDISREDLVPLLLKRVNSISVWLGNRSIDKHRPSSRILRKMLRLTTSDNINVAMKFNAVSLTDTYWVKYRESKITWEEVIQCTDYFSRLITDGEIDLYEINENNRTFELTNVGSYEKCWKKDKSTNEWYIIKKQDTNEVISELIAYKVAKLLNIPVAEYKMLSRNLIKSKNFISNWNYNFEDAFSIVGDEEDVYHNMEAFKNIKESLCLDFVYMKILDAIIMNTDRHTHNYGLLRSVNTGEVISMAPMFDHNMCLLGSKSIMKEKSPGMFFSEVEDAFKLLDVKYRVKLPTLSIDDFKVSEDKHLNNFLYNNYCEILNIIK